MPNPQDVLYRKMAGRGGWTAYLDLGDALKVIEKEKTFHIATINWLIIYMTKLLQSDWLRGVQLFH